MEHKHHIFRPINTRGKKQAGNIFFLLFSSIVIVGAFAVGTSNVMKGIVTSMSDTTRKSLAEEKMMAGARLAIQESTKTGPSFGQCDTDTGYNFVEPLPTRDPGSLPAPVGGGWLPSDIGASTKDPWGTEYGYCAWNLGDGTCVDSIRRLQGGTASSDLVVAVISAGRDRKFSTTCNAYPTATPVTRAAGSDDIVLTYTYDDATGLGGEDLWKVTDTAPDTATIDKNIDVTGSAAFTGALNLMQKGLILPADPGDDSITGVCDTNTDQQLRINTSTSPLSLDICDYAGGNGWTPMSFGSNSSGGMPDGAVAWFKFDEGPGSSSTTDTVSSYAGTMTGFNTTTDWVSGKNGYALRFDGSSTKVDFGAPAPLNNLSAYTMCAWIDPDITGMGGTLATIISKANSGGDRGQENALYMSQTPMYRLGASTRSAPYSEYNNAVWPTNNWVHVCGSWAGGTAQSGVKIYVNGVLLTQTASAGASGNTPVNDTSFNWIIGDNLGASGNYHYKGLMDDVILYDRALTDTEVQNLYTAVGGAAELNDPFIPPSGLIGWWKFDELGGSVAKDSSINNSIGNLKGPVAFVPGKVGYAAYFNGYTNSNSYVDVGNPAAVNDISPVTVCAWIKPDATQSYSGTGIFDKGNTGGGPNTIGISLVYEDSGGVTFMGDKSSKGFGSYFSAGGWHQLCSTWDGGLTSSGINNYIDGTFISTYTWSGNGTVNQVDASYPLTIGAFGGILKENFFHGYIDDVMMFNRVLGAAEIAELYTRDGTITNGSAVSAQPVGGLSCTTAGTGPFVKVGEATGGTDYSFWGDGTYVYTTGGSGVSALSTSLGGTITRIDTKSFGDTGYADVWGDGTYIYAVSSTNLRALTFDGTTITSAASVATGGTNVSVFGDGTYIYVAAGSAGLKAYSFDGAAFTLKGTYAGNMQDVWTDGSYLYVSGGTAAFYVLSFDGNAFTLVDSVDAGTVTQSWGDGRYIYTNANGLIAYSFDGVSLSQIDSVATNLSGIRVWADGQNILIGDNTGILRNYSFNGQHFQPLASAKLSGAINNLWSDGAYLYVGENTKNAQIFSGFECGNSAAPPTSLSMAMDIDRGKISSSDGSCVIKQNGSMWCWGNDALGQLGNGSTITANQETMSRVNSSESWRYTDFGDARACGIASSGLSYCWGDDLGQELGNGAATTQQDSPSLVSGGKYFKKIKTSYSGAVCAIDHDGSMWCWGVDTNGQIGNGAAGGTKNVPTTTTDTGPYVDLGYGRATPCAIKYNGSLWCWGRNDYDQAGVDTAGANITSPTEISDPGPWIRVAAGNYTACAIKTDGTLWCWGSGQDGMLGSGKVEGSTSVPKRVADPGPWVDVDMAHGSNAAIALKADGTIWTWGLNNTYVLGQPTLGAQYLQPTKMADPGPWSAISIGVTHGCAMKLDKSVWCWGDDTYGRLGNGSVATANSATPVAVLNMEKNDPFVWDDAGTLLTASGSGHYLVGSTAGISFDGTNGSSWSNGLVFPGSGTIALRRDSGNVDYLVETGFATGDAELSWKIANPNGVRSMGIDYATQKFVLGNNVTALTTTLGTIASSPQINIGTDGFVGVYGTSTPISRLDINGGLRIGSDTGICIPLRKGTVRYTVGPAPFEYCNGNSWVSF